MLDEVLMKESCPEDFRGENLIGKKIRNLLVVAYLYNGKYGHVWLMRCLECDREIESTRHQINRARGDSCKFCNFKNSRLSYRKDLTGLVFGNGSVVLERGREVRSGVWLWNCRCGCCKNIFENQSSHILEKGDRPKYCRECSKNNRFKNLVGQKFGIWYVLEFIDVVGNGESRWLCQCDCGNIAVKNRGSFIGYRGKFCRSCYRGENIYNYDDTLTEKERVDRRSIDGYLNCIKNVYKRDNYKCIICKSNKNICCHHLNGWKWCEEGRLDENNCVTLCYECHYDFHGIFGRGENTIEQFISWELHK